MTTLLEARSAVLRLANQFPAPSTYADLLATVSDYFDNQVPLNIENKSLMQRIRVLEAALDIAPAEPVRRTIECTSWIGIGSCQCVACRVRAHA